MSISGDVADAVVSELNEHTFSHAFTAERTFLPSYKRAKTTALKVQVVAATLTTEIKTHVSRGKQIQVDVAVMAPVNPLDNTSVDPFVDLLEAIDEFLAFRELEDYPNAAWTGSEMVTGADAGYAPDMLDQNDMFLGLTRINYRIR